MVIEFFETVILISHRYRSEMIDVFFGFTSLIVLTFVLILQNNRIQEVVICKKQKQKDLDIKKLKYLSIILLRCFNLTKKIMGTFIAQLKRKKDQKKIINRIKMVIIKALLLRYYQFQINCIKLQYRKCLIQQKAKISSFPLIACQQGNFASNFVFKVEKISQQKLINHSITFILNLKLLNQKIHSSKNQSLHLNNKDKPGTNDSSKKNKAKHPIQVFVKLITK